MGRQGARAPAALALGQIGKPAVAELKKGNCLAHRLVRSITIRRTSVLGMQAPDSSELALYFPTRRVPCPPLGLDWQIQTVGLNRYENCIV